MSSAPHGHVTSTSKGPTPPFRATERASAPARTPWMPGRLALRLFQWHGREARGETDWRVWTTVRTGWNANNKPVGIAKCAGCSTSTDIPRVPPPGRGCLPLYFVGGSAAFLADGRDAGVPASGRRSQVNRKERLEADQQSGTCSLPVNPEGHSEFIIGNRHTGRWRAGRVRFMLARAVGRGFLCVLRTTHRRTDGGFCQGRRR
jgi:hypothetical protein